MGLGPPSCMFLCPSHLTECLQAWCVPVWVAALVQGHTGDPTAVMVQGQAQLRSITGGREQGVGTMQCWHMPRLLMQELGH